MRRKSSVNNDRWDYFREDWQLCHLCLQQAKKSVAAKYKMDKANEFCYRYWHAQEALRRAERLKSKQKRILLHSMHIKSVNKARKTLDALATEFFWVLSSDAEYNLTGLTHIDPLLQHLGNIDRRRRLTDGVILPTKEEEFRFFPENFIRWFSTTPESSPVYIKNTQSEQYKQIVEALEVAKKMQVGAFGESKFWRDIDRRDIRQCVTMLNRYSKVSRLDGRTIAQMMELEIGRLLRDYPYVCEVYRCTIQRINKQQGSFEDIPKRATHWLRPLCIFALAFYMRYSL